MTRNLLACLLGVILVSSAQAKREACGGSFITDSSAIQFPGEDEALIAGEVCVWTVHLNETQGFRINFDFFDIQSNRDDCSDGGVRIYSLTNLAPPDRIEGYTFCRAKPPPATLFLSGSVALIVSYTGSELTLPGYGFSMNWEGNAFNPVPLRHVSGFTTEEWGSIRYPAQGNYATNLAATWVISTNGTSSDFNLRSLGLQSCGNPDSCTCDALLVYEVNDRGYFRERYRRCADTTNVIFEGLPSHFIVAFFTDSQSQSLGGTGINAEYLPAGEKPTTTTTEIPGIRCGQILGGTYGILRYKWGETYDPNERCVFTLRHTEGTSYTFKLISTGINDTNDGIEFTSLKRVNSPVIDNRVVRYPSTFEMVGNIVIITFYSDGQNEGEGFELEWEAILFFDDINNLSKDYILEDLSTSVRHPYSDDVNYLNYELSTFLYTPENVFNASRNIRSTFESFGIENCTYDHVSAYKFFGDDTFGEPRWNFETRLCDSSFEEITHNDMLLYVFKTDGTGVDKGFNITFNSQ